MAKPFASVFPDELPKGQRVYGLNFATKITVERASIALNTRVITRILGCPKESDFIYSLYCGPKFSPPPPEYSYSASIDPEPITPLAWKVDIDVAKINNAISYNAFRPNCIKILPSETLDPAEGDQTDPPKALYTLPSLFNHSCHPNSVWRCFGDVMVIRARETILPGTEITLPYHSGKTWISREKYLAPIIEGPCECVMCVSERADGENAYRLRQKLIDDMRAARLDNEQSTGSTVVNLKLAQAHTKGLVSTYQSDQGLPRAPLFSAYLHTMQSMDRDREMLNHPNRLKSFIRTGFKALKAAGFTGIDTKLTGTTLSSCVLPVSKECLATCLADIDACTVLMARLSECFLALSEIGCAQSWFRAAWWGNYTLCI